MPHPEQTPNPEAQKQMVIQRVQATIGALREAGQPLSEIPLELLFIQASKQIVALAQKKPEYVQILREARPSDPNVQHISFTTLVPFDVENKEKPPMSPVPTHLWIAQGGIYRSQYEEKLVKYVTNTKFSGILYEVDTVADYVQSVRGDIVDASMPSKISKTMFESLSYVYNDAYTTCVFRPDYANIPVEDIHKAFYQELRPLFGEAKKYFDSPYEVELCNGITQIANASVSTALQE